MAVIHVVGLGPGDLSGLPVGTLQILRSGLPVYLRTEVHPVVEALRGEGIAFTSFDDLYETGDSFAEIYQEMANRLGEAVRRFPEIVYAVPGHPLMAEQSVQNLYQLGDGVTVEIGPGHSFLDAVTARLRIDPIEGFTLVDATELRTSALTPDRHTLVVQMFQQAIASDVKLVLMDVYPDDYPITVIRAAGVKDLERVQTVPLFELDRLPWIDHLTTAYIPPSEDPVVLGKDPWYAVNLVRRLREPGGCPWDRKQTHESLRKYVIEEAYEVVDAIDRGNPDALADELGDLLLQVLLHAQIASEFGDFTVRDVSAALADKLLRRHPHVFGDLHASTEAEAEQVWRTAKRQEQGGSVGEESLFADFQFGRPPFSAAVDAGAKAANRGFDWPGVEPVLEKVQEEVQELVDAIRQGDQNHVAEEFGDVLFSLANVSRWIGVAGEDALRSATAKFVHRYQVMEAEAARQGRNLSTMTPEEQDKLWKLAKKL